MSSTANGAAMLLSAAMVLVIGEGLKRVIDEGFADRRTDRLEDSNCANAPFSRMRRTYRFRRWTC